MHRLTDQVKEFHNAFAIPTYATPGLPERERRELRKRLITEEYLEYVAAEDSDNLVEIADACADLIYVIVGACLEYGIPIEAIFDEVHRSNMTKLFNGKPIRREDGKVLKPSTFEPPEIEKILIEHGYY